MHRNPSIRRTTDSPVAPVVTAACGGAQASAAPLTVADCEGLITRLARVGATVDAEAEPSQRTSLADAGRLEHPSPDAELLALVTALESVKSAVCAAQARLAVVVERLRREDEAAAGVPAGQRGRGVAAEIALARRESPYRGSRLLGLAKALVHEMPHTMALLSRGELNEWRATLMVRETATLDLADRMAVDAELAAELPRLSDRQIADRARVAAYRLDPTSPLRRGRHAVTERYVNLRPAPDTMAILTAYLPVVDGVSCFAALRRAAQTSTAEGDPRSLAQIMADTLTERLTGRSPAVGPDIEVNVIMTDRAMFSDNPTSTGSAPDATADPACTDPVGDPVESVSASPDSADGAVPAAPIGDPACLPDATDDDGIAAAVELHRTRPQSHDSLNRHRAETAHDGGIDEPAFIVGYGPVPAAFARQLLRGGTTADPDRRATQGPVDANSTDRSPTDRSPIQASVWLRRVLTDPVTGIMTNLDTRRRLFNREQRRHLILRDAYCRTPWCGAPIRHADHVVPRSRAGATSIDNGQGLCVRCNQVKEAPGWSARVSPEEGDPGSASVSLTTPSGMVYRSAPPAMAPTRPNAVKPASSEGSTLPESA